MLTKNDMTRLFVMVGGLLAVSTPALADVAGVLAKNDSANTRIKFSDVRWLDSRDAYALTVPRGNGGATVNLQVQLADVAAIQVTTPPNARELAAAVNSGRGAAAIPALEKMVEDYRMLDWDLKMGRWLAQAYLEQGRTDDVIKLFDQVSRKQDKAYGQPIIIPYWQALLKAGKTSALERALDKSVQLGNREVAARAQNMRGDMAMQKEDYETALKDGYLRTWLLFSNVKDVQPEALAKGAECFKAIGQVQYAEKLRKELLEKYPNSSEAKKVR